MDKDEVRKLLEQVADGTASVDDTVQEKHRSR